MADATKDTETQEPEVVTEAEAPAANAPAPKKTRLVAQLRLVGHAAGRGMKSRNGRIALVATLVFVGVSVGMAVLMRSSLVPDEAEPDTPKPMATSQDPGPVDAPTMPALNLSPGELLALGETAISQDQLNRASDLLEAARTAASPESITLQRDIHLAFARLAERQGRATHSKIHLDYVNRLELQIGACIPTYRAAEDALAREDYREARKLLFQFLLRENELKIEREAWVARCRDRLAEVSAREFERSVGTPHTLSEEPETFFQ
ncbi:MAG: hypothetical protein KDB53_20615 [Planctomycetes bacterium]|nr:hypothetical protein [Planctomycetota bacterium]